MCKPDKLCSDCAVEVQEMIKAESGFPINWNLFQLAAMHNYLFHLYKNRGLIEINERGHFYPTDKLLKQRDNIPALRISARPN